MDDSVATPLSRRCPARWNWWQWPHLLSLDAPLVAVVWLWWWAVRFDVFVPANRFFILALAVWMVYVADRTADALHPEGGLESHRHHFHALHRPWLVALLGLGTLALVVGTPLLLPVGQFAEGLVLLGVVGLYFWRIHQGRKGWRRPLLPKEAVVGILFAVGSAFFVLGGPLPAGRATLGVAHFGALCFLNCGLISRWEESPRDLRDGASLLRAYPALVRRLPELALGLAISAGALAMALGETTWLPIGLSALALWLLDRWRHRLSAGSLRVLADLVLLTPLLFAGSTH